MKFTSSQSIIITNSIGLILIFFFNSFILHAQNPPDPSNPHMDPNDDTGEYNNDGVTKIQNPTFEWGASSGADGYQWAVTGMTGGPWNSGDLIQGGDNNAVITNTYQTISNIADGEYRFWVQAHVNSTYWSGWDTYCDFKVDTQNPTPPNSLNNPSNPTTDDTPNVNWSGDYDNSGGSGIWVYHIYFDGTGGNPDHEYYSSDRTLHDVDFNNDELEIGSWDWKVQLTDVAGNVSSYSSTNQISIIEPPGDIDIYVDDQNGNSKQGVKVYQHDPNNWNVIDWDYTNSSGRADFNDLPANSTYHFSAYFPSTVTGGEEYWGYELNVTVNGGSTISKTIDRVMPYSNQILITDQNNQNKTTFYVGETVKIRIRVYNDDNTTHGVKVHCQADRNKTGGIDFDAIVPSSGYENISGNSNEWIDFYYISGSGDEGAYYVRPVETFMDNGSQTLTDSWPWSSSTMFEIINPVGSFDVNVYNVGGSPMEGAKCNLYQGSNYVNFTSFTNASGVASFTGVPVGSDYRVLVYYDGDAPYSETEYWGNTWPPFEITTGSNPDKNLYRYMPYGIVSGGVEFRYDDEYGEIINTGSLVPLESTIWMRVRVYNGDETESFPVRVSSVLDNDQTLPYVIPDWTSPEQTIPFQDDADFTRTFTINELGIFNYSFLVETKHDGTNWEPTDSRAWMDAFEVVSAEGDFNVNVYNVGDTPMEGAKCNLYQGTEYANFTSFTNANGVASFTDIPAGTNYRVLVYYDGDAPYSETEYWGNTWPPFEITTGSNPDKNLYRYMPYGIVSGGVEFRYDDEYGEIINTGSLVPLESTIWMRVRVYNGDETESFPVRVSSVLDNDQTLPYVIPDWTSPEQTIPFQDDADFTRTFTINELGIFNYSFLVETKHDGTNWEPTDSRAWMDAFEVVSAEGDFNVNVYNVGDTPMEGAKCNLYQGTEYANFTSFTNANGVASFTDIPAGTNYRVLVYYDGDPPYSETEYWGNTWPPFEITTGSNPNKNLYRYMPYGIVSGGVEFRYDDEYGEIINTGSLVPLESTIWMRVRVYNGDETESFPVRVSSVLDNNQASPYVIPDWTSAEQTIPNLLDGDFTRTFTINELGIFNYSFLVETKHDGYNWEPTDSRAWMDAFEIEQTVANILVQTQTHQTMDGFGVSGAWVAGHIFGQLSDTERENLLNNLFTDTGADISILRNKIENTNFGYDDNQRQLMQAAISRGLSDFVSAPWSPPPGWMTGDHHLHPDYHDDYAVYIRTYLQNYQNDYSITIENISIQNEPDHYTSDYPTCLWDDDEFENFIPILHTELDNNGLGYVKIVLPEAMGWEHSLGTIQYINGTSEMGKVNILATHGYWGQENNNQLDGYRTQVKDIANNNNQKVWQTEWSDLNTTWDGINMDDPNVFGIDDGIFWAERIWRDLIKGNVSAWMYWWIYNPNDNYPNHNANQGLVVRNQANEIFYPKRFYTFSQFSRFIRSDAQRIELGNVPENNLNAVGFKHAADDEIVIVFVNQNEFDQPISLFLNDYNLLSSYADVYRTSELANEKCSFIAQHNLNDPFSVKAKSVTTLIISADIPESEIEMQLYRISDIDGNTNTADPGTEKSDFSPGETVRITFSAENTGTPADVQCILNIRGPDDQTWVYDSNIEGENNSIPSPINTGETDYFSFDWQIPIESEFGSYDIGASLRNEFDFNILYETTCDGSNTGFNCDWIKDNPFNIIASGSIILEVPYVNQDHANWCWAASMTMLLKYYGFPCEIWQIAASDEFNAGKMDPGQGDIAIQNYLNNFYNKNQLNPWERKTYTALNLFYGIKNKIVSILNQGHPILCGKYSDIFTSGHMIVITGYDQDNVYLHDPSGALFDNDLIHHQISWLDFIWKLTGMFNTTDLALIYNTNDEFTKDCNNLQIQVLPKMVATNGTFSDLYFSNQYISNTSLKDLHYEWDGAEPYIGYKYVTDNDIWYPDNLDFRHSATKADKLNLNSNLYDTEYPFSDRDVKIEYEILNDQNILCFNGNVDHTINDHEDGTKVSVFTYDMFNINSPGEYKIKLRLFDDNNIEQDSKEIRFNLENSDYAGIKVENIAPLFQEIMCGSEGIWKFKITNTGIPLEDSYNLSPPNFYLDGNPITITPAINSNDFIEVEYIISTEGLTIGSEHSKILYYTSSANIELVYNLTINYIIIEDTELPNPLLNEQSNIWNNSNKLIDIDFTDNTALESIYYQINSNDDSNPDNWHSLTTDGVNEITEFSGPEFTDDWMISNADWNALPLNIETQGWHYIYFKVEDAAGNVYITPTQEEAFKFGKDELVPAAWFTDPEDGQVLNTSDVTVSWYVSDMAVSLPMSGVDKIYYAFNQNTNFTEVEPDVSNHTFEGLIDGIYNVYLYATDNAGNESEVKQLSFTVNTSIIPPVYFSLIGPASNSTTTNLTPLFEWNVSSGSNVTYTLWYADNPSFNNKTEIVGLTIEQYTPPTNLDDNQTIYWKVKAVEDDGDIIWSNELDWYFYTNMQNEPPEAFHLNDPENEELVNDPTPYLDWSNSNDPDPDDNLTYNIWVGTDPLFTSGGYTEYSVNESEFTLLGELDANTIYYWKVKAEDENGEITWSDETDWWFETSNNAPLLSWTGEPGYDSDGLDPELGSANSNFEFRILYSDEDGDAPLSGYPQIHMLNDGIDISGSPFTMTEFNSDPFETGRIYSFIISGLEPGLDYSYFFEAQDIQNVYATGDGLSGQPGPNVNGLQILSPNGGEPWYADQSYDITWSSVGLFDSFDLAYSTDNGSNWMDLEIGLIGTETDYSWVLPNEPSTTVLVRITGYFDSQSIFDESNDVFTILEPIYPPDPFSLISPNGIELTTLTPLFEWNPTIDPDGSSINYELWYATNPNYSNKIIIPDLTAAQYTPTEPLNDNSIYYWKVKAIDEDAQETWSTEMDWSFVLNLANNSPNSFSLTGPVNSSLIETAFPTFSWNQSLDIDPNDIVTYTLCYATNFEFTANYVEIPDIETNSVVPSNPLSGNTYYYWKVKAVDNHEAETWCFEDYWWFQTSENPSQYAPTLTWTGEPEYETDGVNPETGYPITEFTFKVKYTDADNDPPRENYPLLHIYNNDFEIASSPYTMTEDDTNPFTTGRIYSVNISDLIPSDYYTYQIEAADIHDTEASGEGSELMIGPEVLEIPPLNAEFSADNTQGVVPMGVQFVDQSTGIISSWLWNFGDGNTSSDPNPSHIYENTGVFTVSLTISDGISDSIEIKSDYITCVLTASISSDFFADVIQGPSPLQVQFTDNSTALGTTISSWAWDFGDGTVSTEQNPQHVYENPGIYSVSLTVSDGSINDIFSRNEYIKAKIIVVAKVFLEGPFAGTEMTTDLNSTGYIPLEQPFSGSPWNYSGSESVPAIPNTDVVDWVLVEFRESEGDPLTSLSSVDNGKRAGFLLKDGSIVDIDGSSPLEFEALKTNDLYLLIWHRNHLGIMSSAPISSSYGTFNYTFTDDAYKAIGEELAQTEVIPGTWAMISGDMNSDGQIDNKDKNDKWLDQNNNTGYFESDLNLDGTVDNTDKDDYWNTNSGKGTNVLPTTNFMCGEDLIDERDGEIYLTNQIGTQCWMAENLNIGTRIDGTIDQTQNTPIEIIEKYCYNNEEDSCNAFGGLYQWSEIMQYITTPGVQGICPDGWHVPTDDEWCILTQFIDPTVDCDVQGTSGTDAGTKMKSTSGWNMYGNGSDEYWFTALPGGYRDLNGDITNLGLTALFWSSKEYYTNNACYLGLNYNNPKVFLGSYVMDYGFSVRCVHDVLIQNQPPSQPSNPSPTNGAIDQSIYTTLSWTCTDPENDLLTYDVYLDIVNPPIILESPDQSETTFDPEGLDSNTEYFWKIVAKDQLNTTEGPVWNFTTEETTWQCGEQFTDDRDGKSYNTVLIDLQCWMAENLNIGSMIDNTITQTNNSIIEKHCYNNEDDSCNIYGGLYQWDELTQYGGFYDTAMQGLCPIGWHIPTDFEWKILEGAVDSYFGINDPIWNSDGFRGYNAGGNLKESGFLHWQAPNTGAINTSCFTALPGGSPEYWSLDASFWTSNGFGSGGVRTRELRYDEQRIRRTSSMILHKNGARCIYNISDPNIVNLSPTIPANPSPSNGDINLPLEVILSWKCSDPEFNQLNYVIYFDDVNPPATILSSSYGKKYYSLNGLELDKTYYWKVVVTDNHENISEGPVWSFTTFANLWQCDDLFFDARNNKSYQTVQIGEQCWMAENINIGAVIDNYTTQLDNNVIEKYCFNDLEDSCDVYGGLYTWDEMMQYNTEVSKGICPQGWHLPNENDWNELINYLGGDAVAGGKMKESGTAHWNIPNFGATNISGFSALPAGLHNVSGLISNLGSWALFWSSTEFSSSSSWIHTLSSSNAEIYNGDYGKNYGVSARCMNNSLFPNQSPDLPANPIPIQGAIDTPINSVLSWACTDPENDPLTYDVYLDVVNPPIILESTDQPETTFDLEGLDPNTEYFWKIVAKDQLNTTEGPVWSFTTETDGSVNLLEGLDHYYKLDGDLIDFVGTNNWTNFGSIDTDGKVNNGRGFNNGTTGQYCTASSIDLSTEVSMSFWFYSYQDQPIHAGVLFKAYGYPHGDQSIFGAQAHDSVLHFSCFLNNSSGGSIDYEFDNNTWYHFVWVFDGQNQEARLYVNGIKTIVSAPGPALYNPISKLKMGMQKYSTRSFHGKLDEIGIWTRVLNDNEVSSLYNNGLGNQYPFEN